MTTLEQELRSLTRIHPVDGGWFVSTTCLLPSGQVVSLHVRGGDRECTVSDAGLALSEIENGGADLQNADRVLARYARRFGVQIENGEFYLRVPVTDVTAGIMLVANAVSQAVAAESAKLKVSPIRDIREALTEFLKTRVTDLQEHKDIPTEQKRCVRIFRLKQQTHFAYISSPPERMSAHPSGGRCSPTGSGRHPVRRPDLPGEEPTTQRGEQPVSIDSLTIGEARQIAALFCGQNTATTTAHHAPRPVVVCTDKRGVVFGTTTDANARPIVLTDARMCLYWSADVGGVFGLADIGPTSDCKISATAPTITLEGVTAVFAVTDAAASAWRSAPVQGR